MGGCADFINERPVLACSIIGVSGMLLIHCGIKFYDWWNLDKVNYMKRAKDAEAENEMGNNPDPLER